MQLSSTTNNSNITITNLISILNTLHQYPILLLEISLVKSITRYYYIDSYSTNTDYTKDVLYYTFLKKSIFSSILY